MVAEREGFETPVRFLLSLHQERAWKGCSGVLPRETWERPAEDRPHGLDGVTGGSLGKAARSLRRYRMARSLAALPMLGGRPSEQMVSTESDRSAPNIVEGRP
jgi:hypothetical protein